MSAPSVAVVISKADYDAIENMKLENLRAEVQKGIAAVERGEFEELERTDVLRYGETLRNKARNF